MCKVYSILTLVLMIIGVGCENDDRSDDLIQYPGAPIISIHQTSIDSAGYIKFRVEAQEPLPYAISVRVGIQGVVDIEGTVHDFEEVRKVEMREGTSVFGKGWRNVHLIPAEMRKQESLARRITLTLDILEWSGLGDAPYNIGNPSSFTVTTLNQKVPATTPPNVRDSSTPIPPAKLDSVVPSPGATIPPNQQFELIFDRGITAATINDTAATGSGRNWTASPHLAEGAAMLNIKWTNRDGSISA